MSVGQSSDEGRATVSSFPDCFSDLLLQHKSTKQNYVGLYSLETEAGQPKQFQEVMRMLLRHETGSVRITENPGRAARYKNYNYQLPTTSSEYFVAYIPGELFNLSSIFVVFLDGGAIRPLNSIQLHLIQYNTTTFDIIQLHLIQYNCFWYNNSKNNNNETICIAPLLGRGRRKLSCTSSVHEFKKLKAIIQYNTIQLHLIQYSTTVFGIIQYNCISYNRTAFDTIQCSYF